MTGFGDFGRTPNLNLTPIGIHPATTDVPCFFIPGELRV
jgi:hypothetical protein